MIIPHNQILVIHRSSFYECPLSYFFSPFYRSLIVPFRRIFTICSVYTYFQLYFYEDHLYFWLGLMLPNDSAPRQLIDVSVISNISKSGLSTFFSPLLDNWKLKIKQKITFRKTTQLQFPLSFISFIISFFKKYLNFDNT